MRIEDYALVGDCHSAALVGRNGSIDWLCWPQFDSPACFAALLGNEKNGHWQIAPAAAGYGATRAYRADTLVLETVFESDAGEVALVDFMSMRGEERCRLLRMVCGRRGRMAMRMHLVLRLYYGSVVPWVTRLADGHGIHAIAGPDLVVLHSPVPLQGRDFTTVASFDVKEGDCLAFELSHTASHRDPPAPLDPHAALAETEAFWKRWSAQSNVSGRWGEPVRRSLLTLKALTYQPTGAIVAAPTTSLPEQLGSVRNWDYRFCWLRDATLTLLALMGGGYHEAALAWRNWLLRAVAGDPKEMQIMYGIRGERHLAEWLPKWLAGYEGSSPVRIGNAAAGQLQLDVYGEVMDALYQACKAGLTRHDAAWDLQVKLLEHLEKIWREPDEGIWEVRGGRRHFVYSKLMSWVAFDRAVKIIEHFGLPGPLEKWRAVRDEIHQQVCRNGYSAQRQSFVQSYGAQELDASLLLIPNTGFLPATDPRVAGTIKAIERDLMENGLVLRYRTRESLDGLPGGEGFFLACSFWLADALLMQGRRREAEEQFERLLGLANDVGLFAEEYDPFRKRFLGNFPQAFTHVGLINTALNLTKAEKPAEQRAEKKAA